MKANNSTLLLAIVLLGCAVPVACPQTLNVEAVSVTNLIEVTVSVGALGETKVQKYRFEPGTVASMMHLVFKMGGIPMYSDDTAVRVIRMGPDGSTQEFRINLREILKSGDPELDFELKNGDKVEIWQRLMAI